MRTHILACLLFFLPAVSFSQETWSLEKCIEYALTNNLQIKQSRLDMEIADENVLQSKGQFLPSVNGNAYHQFNYGRTIDPYTNQFATDWVQSSNFSIGADLVLFNGLQNYRNYQQNKYALEASRSGLKSTEYDIILSITQAYMEILFTIENLKVAYSQVATTEQQVERTRKLVNAGSSAQSDLLDIEAQLANEELNVVDLENQQSISYLNLLQLLQLSGETDFAIETPDSTSTVPEQLPPSPEGIIGIALSSYPSLQQAEYQKLNAESYLRLTRGGYSPTLSLSGRIATGYSGIRTYDFSTEVMTFGDQFDVNLNRTIGFNLTVPIFNRFTTYTNVGKAKIQLEQANTAFEQEEQRIRQTIEQAYADAKAAYKRYYATEKSMRALEMSFNYAEKRFDVGAINAVDYTVAKNNLTQAQADLIRAKYEYRFRFLILQLYKGETNWTNQQ